MTQEQVRGAEGVEKQLNGLLTGELGYREYAEDGTLVVRRHVREESDVDVVEVGVPRLAEPVPAT